MIVASGNFLIMLWTFVARLFSLIQLDYHQSKYIISTRHVVIGCLGTDYEDLCRILLVDTAHCYESLFLVVSVYAVLEFVPYIQNIRCKGTLMPCGFRGASIFC